MKGKKFGFPEYVRGGGRFTVTCVVMCSVWRFVLSYHVMCIGGPYIVNLCLSKNRPVKTGLDCSQVEGP